VTLNIAKRALVEAPPQHCADSTLQDENSDTALHISIRNGYFETNKLLLKAGAKCKIPGARFGTAVNLTIRDCTLEWTELIIDHAHGFDIRGEDGTVTLFRALENADCERAQLLLARDVLVTATSKNRETQLHSAAKNGEICFMKNLVLLGVNLNALDRGGAAALHSAVQSGNDEAAQGLCEAGAIVTWRIGGDG
jgi:ankyrin repeat protein